MIYNLESVMSKDQTKEIKKPEAPEKKKLNEMDLDKVSGGKSGPVTGYVPPAGTFV